MHIQKTAVRNREIFAARQQGESIAELAELYGLSNITVCEIIRVERHKIAVSIDTFYQEMRSEKQAPQTNRLERRHHSQHPRTSEVPQIGGHEHQDDVDIR